MTTSAAKVRRREQVSDGMVRKGWTITHVSDATGVLNPACKTCWMVPERLASVTWSRSRKRWGWSWLAVTLPTTASESSS